MLKKSLYDITLLETKKYLIQQFSSKITQRVSELKNEKKRLLEEKERIKKSKPIMGKVTEKEPSILANIITFLIGCIIIYWVFKSLSSIQWIGCIVVFIATEYSYNKKQKAYDEAYNRVKNKYKEEYNNYIKQEVSNASSLTKIDKDLSKCNMLRQDLVLAERRVDSSLLVLYSKVNIYYKYRNIVAMTTMYDYIAAGICTTLEGPNGAYKFFEEQAMRKHIATTIHDAMEQNFRHQRFLETSLQNARTELHGMESKLKNADKNYNQLKAQVEKLKNATTK